MFYEISKSRKHLKLMQITYIIIQPVESIYCYNSLLKCEALLKALVNGFKYISVTLRTYIHI